MCKKMRDKKRRCKISILSEVNEIAILLSMIVYAVGSFCLGLYEVGREWFVIRLFLVFWLFRALAARRVLRKLQNDAKGRLLYFIMYVPYGIYSVWFACWMVLHAFPAAVLSPILICILILYTYTVLFKTEEDRAE